jgi:hypothetical protein
MPNLRVLLLLALLPTTPALADEGDEEEEEAAAGRSCPTLRKAPDTLYADFMAGAVKVNAKNIPYRSCNDACQKSAASQTRNQTLASLVGGDSFMISVGKGSADQYMKLANALDAKGRTDEWADLAGLDCNGFTSQFLYFNHASVWGPDLNAIKNIHPTNMVAAAKQRSILPIATSDVCEGDLIVYNGVSHISLIGKKVGDETVGGVPLTLFQVYESQADPHIKKVAGLKEALNGNDPAVDLDGLVNTVEGLNAAGTVLYIMQDLGDGSYKTLGTRNVTVIPQTR